ncbi:MAG: alpha/beta hydrolase [Firmicutes bacterium]|nr:alpha/beta hydrolase [Bacillota bacterium]
MFKFLRGLGFVFALVIFFGFIGFLIQSYDSSRVEKTLPPPGEIVDLGTHSLHVNVVGSDGYPIVLESAIGGWSEDWSLVVPLLADLGQVVVYDRAGYGWSEVGALLRSPEIIVEELNQLLAGLELEPPYILVGHSEGASYIHLFASKYPEKVAGLVFLDARIPEFEERVPAAKQGREMNQKISAILGGFSRIGVFRLAYWAMGERMVPMVQEFPKETQDRYVRVGLRPKYFETVRNEGMMVEEMDLLVKEAGGFKNTPLVVVSQNRDRDNENTESKEAWIELQQDLTKLSTTSTFMFANTSNHQIHIYDPETVVEAVQWVIERIR